ncbi:MAG: site-specific DNA-methyltransferase [Lachnoclostridium sp.]|nr:site-specific DNA-methyltransferase [Lachnospira sp.]MCM1247150.1 site-specific DNA-methyltransferase [Lachnoclostridium sp.]
MDQNGTDYQKVPQQINDVVGDNVKKLAQLFPSAVKDGEVDFDALKNELGDFREIGAEKYELTWSGKKDAKKLAQEDIIGKTLKFIPEDSKNADTTENLYIEGDNLEVLKLLRQNYYGAIKMIYIDPPYNRGNDFIYNDSYEISKAESDVEEGIANSVERYTINAKSQNRFHARWLSMMFSRLIIAKDFLTDDGMIFISIDDNEIGNLIKICNEVFGEQNFVSLLSVEINPKGRKNSKYISVSNDYCLIYAKNISNGYFVENIPKNIKDLTKDENGNYVHNSGKRVLVGENDFNNVVLDFAMPKHYTVYYNFNTKEIELRKERKLDDVNQTLLDAGFTRYYSYKGNTFVENTYTAEKFMDLFNEQKLEFKNGKIYEKNMSTEIRLKSMLINRNYEAIVNEKVINFSLDYKTTSAKETLKELFDSEDEYFTAPKNVGLLKVLMTLFAGKDFLVLDFFSGSGTTAHAVMEQNIIDGGQRRYILIQWPEEISEKYASYKAGFRTICEIGKERIRLAGDKLQKEHFDSNTDIGFRVFRIDDTNIKWNSSMNVGQLNLNQIESTPDLIDFMPNAKDVDIVYELMLRQKNVPLSSEMEQVFFSGGYRRTYLYAHSYLVCLETKITEELVDKLAGIDPLPIKYIFRDSAFQDDIALKDETFRRLRALIEKNNGMNKMAYTVEFI